MKEFFKEFFSLVLAVGFLTSVVGALFLEVDILIELIVKIFK